MEVDRPRMLFAGFEHAHIGERIDLKIDELRILTLPNGVEIKFEHIVALAGDHYGIPEHPVIAPFEETDEPDSGRHKRFLDAYNTLARVPKDEIQDELNQLLATLNEERLSGKEADPKDWDEITGGQWLGGLPIQHGRMLKLAAHNHDHFLPYAKDAYLTGHQLAMDKAREASKCDGYERKMLLHEAYSLDAFGVHFLTDSFASGHIRTPRIELRKKTTPASVGDLLSKFMHDEDGKYGLRVTNARGDKWIAYGDGMLLDEKSKDNLKFVSEAVQISVDQVHGALQDPSKIPDPAAVTSLIPFVDQEEKNNYPLFQMKDGQVHRRSDISNLQDIETVTNWWGATTLAKLYRYNPHNSAI